MTMNPETDKLLIEAAESLRAYARDVREACKAGKLTQDAAQVRLDAGRKAFTALIELTKLEGPDFSME